MEPVTMSCNTVTPSLVGLFRLFVNHHACDGVVVPRPDELCGRLVDMGYCRPIDYMANRSRLVAEGIFTTPEIETADLYVAAICPLAAIPVDALADFAPRADLKGVLDVLTRRGVRSVAKYVLMRDVLKKEVLIGHYDSVGTLDEAVERLFAAVPKVAVLARAELKTNSVAPEEELPRVKIRFAKDGTPKLVTDLG